MKKALFIFLIVFTAHQVFAQTGGIRGSRSSNVKNKATIVNDAAASETVNVLMEENMDDVSLLPSKGWIFNNVDAGGITSYFQGNDAVFYSYNGETDSYLGQNFNGANGSLIDQWLITPEITCNGLTRFSFLARYTGDIWMDHIYIYYSPTGSSNINDFVLLRDRTSLTAFWNNYSELINISGTVRFAVRYYETDGGISGLDSDYWGIDNVRVIGSNSASVPVSIWWTLGIFILLAIGIAGRKLIF